MPGSEEERKRPLNCDFPAMNTMAPDQPEKTAENPNQCCGVLDYVENHPVAAVIQALAIGFGVGMLVRLVRGTAEKEPEIDLKRKPGVDDVKFHLGSLVLPLLWPAWQKAQEGYGKSAERVREAVGKVNANLTTEGKARLKQAEEWAELEAERVASLGKKKAHDVEDWVERETGHLTEAGLKKAKEFEHWLEKEILPTAQCGWKRLRKFFG
jgi:hypothetical protein